MSLEELMPDISCWPSFNIFLDRASGTGPHVSLSRLVSGILCFLAMKRTRVESGNLNEQFVPGILHFLTRNCVWD